MTFAELLHAIRVHDIKLELELTVDAHEDVTLTKMC